MAAEAVAGLAGGFLFIFFLMFLIMPIVGILAMIFWIFMIVDVAQRKFKNENDKILWILVVVLAGIIGAIIYYFIIKQPNKH